MAVPWSDIIIGLSFIVAWSAFWKVTLDVVWAVFGEAIVEAQLDFEEMIA